MSEVWSLSTFFSKIHRPSSPEPEPTTQSIKCEEVVSSSTTGGTTTDTSIHMQSEKEEGEGNIKPGIEIKQEGESGQEVEADAVKKEEGESTTATSVTKDEEANKEEDGLDLVFCVDCTGSMGSYLMVAQQNIRDIIDGVIREEQVNVRFGLVCYRDHPPQDFTYVTKVFPLTSSVQEMKAYVDTMSAKGGGDGPEAVADGLYQVLNMAWREDAAKVSVLIADAPPHGLGEQGDGFPNGCPLGHDPLAIARQCAEAGITIYAVGCQPAVNSYHACRDFLISVAELTHGQALVLESASLLARVIMGTAQEEINLTRLQREVVREMAHMGRDLTEDAYVALIGSSLKSKKTITKQLRTDTGSLRSRRADVIASCTSMEEARSKLDVAQGGGGGGLAFAPMFTRAHPTFPCAVAPTKATTTTTAAATAVGGGAFPTAFSSVSSTPTFYSALSSFAPPITTNPWAAATGLAGSGEGEEREERGTVSSCAEIVNDVISTDQVRRLVRKSQRSISKTSSV